MRWRDYGSGVHRSVPERYEIRRSTSRRSGDTIWSVFVKYRDGQREMIAGEQLGCMVAAFKSLADAKSFTKHLEGES